MLDERLKRMKKVKGELHLKDGYDCEKCNNTGYEPTIIKGELVQVVCGCMKKREILKTIKNSGLEHEFKKSTFDNFTTEEKWQRTFKSLALTFVDKIKNGGKNWLVLSGRSGGGKTHIGVAVSYELIMSGFSFEYLSYARDMPRLQARMRSGFMEVKEKQEKRFEYLLNVDILYIDDFLKLADNSYVFELIDGRYVRNKVTIISTELSEYEQKTIDVATTSRIYEKSKGFWLDVGQDESRDYRRKETRNDENK